MKNLPNEQAPKFQLLYFMHCSLSSNDCFTHIDSSSGLWFLHLSTLFELSWFAQVRNQKVNFSSNVRLSVALLLHCINNFFGCITVKQFYLLSKCRAAHRGRR